mmetsp:Transcript_162491/g.520857  ORF Transcript_162491/g.520857 Transcript_162491/m.520857 type:complete len:297 (+) Transcript_162491:77-967(+)
MAAEGLLTEEAMPYPPPSRCADRRYAHPTTQSSKALTQCRRSRGGSARGDKWRRGCREWRAARRPEILGVHRRLRFRCSRTNGCCTGAKGLASGAWAFVHRCATLVLVWAFRVVRIVLRLRQLLVANVTPEVALAADFRAALHEVATRFSLGGCTAFWTPLPPLLGDQLLEALLGTRVILFPCLECLACDTFVRLRATFRTELPLAQRALHGLYIRGHHELPTLGSWASHHNAVARSGAPIPHPELQKLIPKRIAACSALDLCHRDLGLAIWNRAYQLVLSYLPIHDLGLQISSEA